MQPIHPTAPASRHFGRLRPLAWFLGTALVLVPTIDRARADDDDKPATSSRPWTVTRRVISQHQADGQTWQVDYQLRNDGPDVRVVPPGAVVAEVDGWVSNSRVPDHATPRRASATVSGPFGPSVFAPILDARDESRRCRERLTLEVWPASAGEVPPNPWGALAAPDGAAFLGLAPAIVPPGQSLRVRLLLEHDHFLYGPYEPLLGPRSVVLRVASAVVRDELPLDQELTGARLAPSWPATDIPPDRLDPEVFVTPPDSLHLAAHVPGCGSARFNGPVRYGARMRLSFWYLIAPGTEGDCKARISQYMQGPGVHRTLHDADSDQYLTTIGRWTRVERIIRTDRQATSLTLEFKLTGDLGEMWVDDVALEPLDAGLGAP